MLRWKKVDYEIAKLYERDLVKRGYKFRTTLNMYGTDKIYIFIKGKLKDGMKAIVIRENTTYMENGRYDNIISNETIFIDYLGYYIKIYKGKKLYLHEREFSNAL